jgi:hypothetical protein
MDKLKWYLVQIGLKRYVPMGVMAGMGAFGTLMAAHAEILEKWGVNYIAQWTPSWATTHDITGAVLLIELDTTSASFIAFIGAVAVIMLRASEHHVVGNSPPIAAANPPQEPPKA